MIRSKNFSAFLTLNPECCLEEEDGEYYIDNPWGDDSLIINISDDTSERRTQFSLLKELRLLPSFSGVYHTSLKRLELIYTAFPAPDIYDRDFEFDFEGQKHRCKFDDCSAAVLMLAEHSEFVGPPEAGHRNLQDLSRYLNTKAKFPKSSLAVRGRPISFFVDSVSSDASSLLDLILNLNFYMNYFDADAPLAVIHEPDTTQEFEDPDRYLISAFPGSISGRALNPYLLGLLTSAHSAHDPLLSCVYFYQVIEFVASLHVKESHRAALAQILRNPKCQLQSDLYVDKIVGLMSDEGMHDSQKISLVVQDLCELESVWRVIKCNKEFFSLTHKCDGGYTIPTVCNSDWNFDDFTTGMSDLGKILREMRNGIVHAKQSTNRDSIDPTSKNRHLIELWTYIFEAVAKDVTLHCRH